MKQDKPKNKKQFRVDNDGNYWIGNMRFTKGTLIALGIVGFIMSWFVVGIFFGNSNFFDDFNCDEVDRYLKGDKMGYVLHKDLPDSQHEILHELVIQCKAEKAHANADNIEEFGPNLGMIGELFN
jgi:hypothetical protein